MKTASSFDPVNSGAFISPDGCNKDEIDRIFRSSAGLLIDFLSSAGNKPLLPSDDALQGLKFELPENPLSHDAMQHELAAVLRMSMNPGNPSYLGHMDSLPTTYSVIGSLFSAALNNNMFSVEMSPYFTRLEHFLLIKFAALFGLPDTASGVIVSGGTLSNIQAIIVARNNFLKRADGDLSTSAQKPVLFASEHAHVSIRKAAMICGIGTDSLVLIKSDASGKMSVADLKQNIAHAKNCGQQPFAAVATIGTTVTGNIDPIEEIAAICRQHNIWFHADAIYGGAIILSNRQKHRLKGIEFADSIAFNPQKWLHVAKTCSMLIFRDAEILKKYFSMKAYYTKIPKEYINLSELNIQGTKHAEVLKLWLSILSIGLSGYEKLIDDAYLMTDKFIQKLKQLSYIQFASEPEMNIPTFRLTGKTEEESDILNKEYNEYAIREHNLFFSLPVYNGRLWQRTILLNPFINDAILEKVIYSIVQFKTNKR